MKRSCLLASCLGIALTLAASAQPLLAGGDVRRRGRGITVGTPPAHPGGGGGGGGGAEQTPPARPPVNPHPENPAVTNPPAAEQPPTAVNTIPVPLPLPGFVDQADQSSRVLSQLEQAGAFAATYTGLGRVAGDMVNMQVVNRGSTPLALHFVPGMVLEARAVGQAQPLMLEQGFDLSLQPNESTTRPLACYCLDYHVDPPQKGTVVGYDWSNRVSEHWAIPARTLAAGLQLDQANSFRAAFPPLQHRRIVIQRAIWQSLGQIKGEPELRRDLAQESDGQLSRRATERIVKRVSDDVAQTLETAKTIR